MLVNTMGWVDGLGYELLLHSIQALKADVVLVVGQDRLHSQLRNELRSVCQQPGGPFPKHLTAGFVSSLHLIVETLQLHLLYGYYQLHHVTALKLSQ